MIPRIDAEIGISTFSTKFKGCGGKIREKAEDFVVSEILSKKNFRYYFSKFRLYSLQIKKA